MINYENIKKQLENDNLLKVITIEHITGFFIYENVMIINYDGNGYRIIFDNNNVLIQMLVIGDVVNGITYFDDAIDFENNNIKVENDNIIDIIKNTIAYCEHKFGKFTDYEY